MKMTFRHRGILARSPSTKPTLSSVINVNGWGGCYSAPGKCSKSRLTLDGKPTPIIGSQLCSGHCRPRGGSGMIGRGGRRAFQLRASSCPAQRVSDSVGKSEKFLWVSASLCDLFVVLFCSFLESAVFGIFSTPLNPKLGTSQTLS